MYTKDLVEVKPTTPLLLRRIQRKPTSESLVQGTKHGHGVLSHITIATTPSLSPEMNDQQDDATRYDKD